MTNNLILCYKKKILTSLYCDPDDRQKHYTGYIMGINDREILIAHISQNGYYDGYVLRRVEDVYRIDYNGEYERKIEALYKARGQSHNVVSTKDGQEELFFSALEFAKKNNLVISLILDDDCRSGLIKNYDNDVVCLYALNDNGEEDGVAIVSTAEISVFEIDTDYEQDLKLLSQQWGQGDGLREP